MTSGLDGRGRGLLLDLEAAQAAAVLLSRSADRSPAVQEALEHLGRLGRDGKPLWIYGEPGSGRRTAAIALPALTRGEGPVLLLHRAELEDVVALWGDSAPGAQRAARQLLDGILARAGQGTLVLDEGGAADLGFQALAADLLRGPLGPRLVLVTAAQSAGDVGMRADLLGRLSRRCVRMPPLRQRPEELSALVEALLQRRGRPGALAIEEDAARLLAEQPLRGNLRQLDLALLRLPAFGRVGAAELRAHLGLTAAAQPDPAQLRELAQALGTVLRLALPLLSGEAEEPWAPLVLLRDDRDPVGVYRIRRGPAPLDESVIGAGLRPRPRGPGGGGRIGDEPVLAGLGHGWRGQLLVLLRTAHEELGGAEIGLEELGLALLLAGPPVPPEKLLRLLLRRPVEFLPEETAALLGRLQAAVKRPAPACTDPVLGRSWADAARGLLPREAEEAAYDHASGCVLCAEALWGYFLLPDLGGAGETLPRAVPVDGYVEEPAPQAQGAEPPVPLAAPAAHAEAAASATSPVPAPPPLLALRPGHWVLLTLLIAAALVVGTLFGMYLGGRRFY